MEESGPSRTGLPWRPLARFVLVAHRHSSDVLCYIAYDLLFGV
jgi:hypothetical protein